MTAGELHRVTCAAVDAATDDLIALSRFLHANPEVAYEEHRAASYLAEFLERRGFRVERPVGGLPTAFRASLTRRGTRT